MRYTHHEREYSARKEWTGSHWRITWTRRDGYGWGAGFTVGRTMLVLSKRGRWRLLLETGVDDSRMAA